MDSTDLVRAQRRCGSCAWPGYVVASPPPALTRSGPAITGRRCCYCAPSWTTSPRSRLPFTTQQSSEFYAGAWTLEEAAEKILNAWGPVIAIGRPGEGLPPAGAAREYVAGDAWQVCQNASPSTAGKRASAERKRGARTVGS